MIEKTTLESLDVNKAWLLKTVLNDSGLEVSRWRKGYYNSTDVVCGRPAVQAEVSDPYRSAIMVVWGDNPTITDE